MGPGVEEYEGEIYVCVCDCDIYIGLYMYILRKAYRFEKEVTK
jgi:hypothetical protein